RLSVGVLDIGAHEFGISATTGIASLSDQPLLYPNPTSNAVHMDLPDWPNQTVQVRIFDETGRQVTSKLCEIRFGKLLISDVNLLNGRYILNLQGGRMSV